MRKQFIRRSFVRSLAMPLRCVENFTIGKKILEWANFFFSLVLKSFQRARQIWKKYFHNYWRRHYVRVCVGGIIHVQMRGVEEGNKLDVCCMIWTHATHTHHFIDMYTHMCSVVHIVSDICMHVRLIIWKFIAVNPICIGLNNRKYWNFYTLNQRKNKQQQQ